MLFRKDSKKDIFTVKIGDTEEIAKKIINSQSFV